MCSYIKHTGICVFVLFMKRKTNQKYVDKTRDAFVCWWCILEIKTLLSRFFSILIFWTYMEFYHGYCKDQRNAAVIILRYTMLRHNELWYTSLLLTKCEEIFFNTMWGNLCIWSSKQCLLHVDFTFQMWCWPCMFRCKNEALFQVSLPLLKHIVDKNK